MCISSSVGYRPLLASCRLRQEPLVLQRHNWWMRRARATDLKDEDNRVLQNEQTIAATHYCRTFTWRPPPISPTSIFIIVNNEKFNAVEVEECCESYRFLDSSQLLIRFFPFWAIQRVTYQAWKLVRFVIGEFLKKIWQFYKLYMTFIVPHARSDGSWNIGNIRLRKRRFPHFWFWFTQTQYLCLSYITVHLEFLTPRFHETTGKAWKLNKAWKSDKVLLSLKGIIVAQRHFQELPWEAVQRSQS